MTRDGVRLDGSLQVPAAAAERKLPVDALLFIHGTGGTFYSSTLFDSFAERFLQLGVAVLRVNTRGHDLISTAATTEGGRRCGAAYEVFDECRHDLTAWIDWLIARGFRRVGLVGHSSGAVKAIYTLAHEPQPAVTSLVALSPPSLSYARFAASADGPKFVATIAEAERLVREGQSMSLMDVQVPLSFLITAGGFVEKYGPDERFDLLKFITRVTCPMLITFGSIELESSMAFRELPELLAPVATARGKMRVDVIPDADHFYSGQRADVVRRTEEWLSRECRR
jgi:pimeloyl-ACP methyl ester carboxylesterase